MQKRDFTEYFKIETCFLCAEKPDMDFNAVHDGVLYRALICFGCFVAYESDRHLLLELMKKANQLHAEQEQNNDR